MAKLLDLPPELLRAIAGHLAEPREQGALAALARVDQLFNTIVMPLLIRKPAVVGKEAFGAFLRTMEAGCWIRGAVEGTEMAAISFADITSDQFSFEISCGHCSSWEHLTEDHDRTFGQLLRLVRADAVLGINSFLILRSLSFTDSFVPAALLAHLLGPGKPLRQTLETFKLVRGGMEQELSIQFLFQHLLFNHTSRAWGIGTRDLSEDERIAISMDYDAFKTIQVDAEWTEETEELYLASPPSAHPFFNLQSLELSIASETGDELFLIFCTNLFPSLRELKITGSFEAWVLMDSERFFLRRSIYQPSGSSSTFLPPVLTGLLPSPAELAQLWLPLSATEVASDAFKSYRGPTLSLLDLSGLTLNLVE
ncbi:hypothetical protein BCR35DRAFT_350029 [Leucosporidium creatinivorum]|uniref:Uncharacterized protein n=1 Tax=Leucosporidium creatinivorum TaxID=106004 RepID=A0A1Y2G2M9_9BASI|nr:hypothetical protein BCR35DRAFT_350029 [Leucosporidium creatinivorum]